MTRLQGLLSQIDSETMVLPEFQVGYVWNQDQISGLLRSRYLDYPLGSLLAWETEAMSAKARSSEQAANLDSGATLFSARFGTYDQCGKKEE